MRVATRTKGIRYPENDEAAAFARIEDAGAIGESASFATKFANLPLLPVEDFDGLDRLGDFLPVGSDILNGRAADAAGDPAQAFDSGTICCDRVRDEAVPRFTGSHLEDGSAVVVRAAFDACGCNFDHEPRPAGIGDDKIAATAEHKQRQIPRCSEDDGFSHFGRRAGFDEELRRTSDAEGCQGSKRNVFLQQHGSLSIYTEEGSSNVKRRRLTIQWK